MTERWVKCGGRRFNLHHVTHLDVAETDEDGVFAVKAYFLCDCYNPFQVIVVNDRDHAWQIVDNIIRGDYDVPMGAEPTDAQGGDGLPDPVFNIGDAVTVHSVVNGERQRPPDAEGVVVHYQLGEDGLWEYQVRYDDGKVSEWLPEVHLFHDLPF